jgi:hypothetical protein
MSWQSARVCVSKQDIEHWISSVQLGDILTSRKNAWCGWLVSSIGTVRPVFLEDVLKSENSLWNTVLEKLTAIQLGKKFPAVYKTPEDS